MKPKVKDIKLLALKKEPARNETAAPPLAGASTALPSAAKQQKRQKLLQAKLKRAAKLGNVEASATTATGPPLSRPPQQQKKRQQQQQQLPKQEQPEQQNLQKQQQTKNQQPQQLPKQEQPKPQNLQQQQQTKKRKLPAVAAEKRPRIEGGAAAPTIPAAVPVRDPILRSEIAACLRHRAASTVRVRQLPRRLRLAQVYDLCQGIQAARVPWNYAAGHNKGVAFLEFASPEAASRSLEELNASKALGVRLVATMAADATAGGGGGDVGDFGDVAVVDVDAYNCRRVVVSSLHPHTTGQQLKDLVGGGGVLRVDFLHGSKALNKCTPAVAFLTFDDERRALDAVKSFHGTEIRGRRTSWMLQKQSDRPEHDRHRTQLVAFGVSKRVADDALLKAFPNSRKIDVRQGHGMAVVDYATEAECRADFDACKGGIVRLGKAVLRVQLGHAHHKPVEQRRAEAAAAKSQEQQSQEEQQQQQLHRPRKQPQAPPTAQNIDPSLFNKAQLVLKNFKPATQEADLTGFLEGVRRVFFTPNRRLAFVHFAGEGAAAAALAKLRSEPLNGAKLKAMYAMDKPEKKAQVRQAWQERSGSSAVAAAGGDVPMDTDDASTADNDCAAAASPANNGAGDADSARRPVMGKKKQLELGVAMKKKKVGKFGGSGGGAGAVKVKQPKRVSERP